MHARIIASYKYAAKLHVPFYNLPIVFAYAIRAVKLLANIFVRLLS